MPAARVEDPYVVRATVRDCDTAVRQPRDRYDPHEFLRRRSVVLDGQRRRWAQGPCGNAGLDLGAEREREYRDHTPKIMRDTSLTRSSERRWASRQVRLIGTGFASEPASTLDMNRCPSPSRSTSTAIASMPDATVACWDETCRSIAASASRVVRAIRRM